MMFCNFVIKMFKMEGCMWLFRGERFASREEERVEVAHTSPSYSPAV